LFAKALVHLKVCFEVDAAAPLRDTAEGRFANLPGFGNLLVPQPTHIAVLKFLKSDWDGLACRLPFVSLEKEPQEPE
jgi:hypothetical protein